MRDSFHIKARISLFSTRVGGLEHPQPSPSRSLLIRVQPQDGEPITMGGNIDSGTGSRLRPGTRDVVCTIECWAADEARAYLKEGARFELLYFGNRPVGEGIVEAQLTCTT